MTGASRLKMDEVAQRFSKLADIDIRASGIHEADLNLRAVIDNRGDVDFTLATDVGWESGHFAGMNIGGTTVPIILTETSLEVEQTQIPVNSGKLVFAGQMHYRPGPLMDASGAWSDGEFN